MVTEKFWNDVKERDQNQKRTMVTYVPQKNPSFNKSVLLQTIENVDNMNDAELAKFINYNFDNILASVFNGYNRVTHVRCFQDPKFLDSLITVLEDRRFFNPDEIVRLNTIIYEYMTIPDNNGYVLKDPHVLDKMRTISRIINRAMLPRLLGLGLSDNLANALLIARYSSVDVAIIIKRIDFILITQPKELMTQQMIAEIFKILYDVFTEWSKIFPYIMEDVLPIHRDGEYSWITEDVEEVDSALSLAILDILDNLPRDIIYDTLRNYAEGYYIMGQRPVRFSMNRLSDDYYRINEAAYRLNQVENTVVP